MISFDIGHPKYFTRQNRFQQYLARSFYILLGVHAFMILSNFSKNIRYLRDEFYFEMRKMMILPIVTFLFFISDEFERVLLIFFYFFVVMKFFIIIILFLYLLVQCFLLIFQKI